MDITYMLTLTYVVLSYTIDAVDGSVPRNKKPLEPLITVPRVRYIQAG
jgi:hypothetical protein